jgi:hypothetical protein
MCFEKSPVNFPHFSQFISVLLIDVSNAQVIYHQAEEVIMCIMLSEAGEISFVPTKLGWTSVMFRKYWQGPCVQGITYSSWHTHFTAANTGLKGFPCVAHSVHRIVKGQHSD